MQNASERRNVPVSEIMTSQVRTAEPSQALGEIWRMLEDERCHHVPIVENGRPVGMISARDLVRAARGRGADPSSDGLAVDLTAGEIMSTDLETIQTNESVEVAIDRIGRGDIHALVVLGPEKQLAGIVTHRDLLQYLVS